MLYYQGPRLLFIAGGWGNSSKACGKKKLPAIWSFLAVETAIKYRAYGVDYLENILHQTTRPQSPYPKIVLQNPSLNPAATGRT